LDAPTTIAEDLVAHVLNDGVALLSRTATLPGKPPTAVLAAPLSGEERPAGLVYLGAADPRIEFDEDHLQITTALAAVAGRALGNLREVARLESENLRLREEIDIEHDMVGESAAMREVYRFVAKVAPTESSVLITGESGTGKELVARAIHRNSGRARGPLVAVNCAALTESLLESELFGHERGAFTGAIAQKKGKFEVADGGTLFLDEVGELPLSLQAKLLRVLQEREFERVGGLRPLRVDVRVIAATNRDLRADRKEGRFREDLFYRLNVVSCRMPPLRERRDDIPLLASYFAQKHGRRMGRGIAGVSRGAQAVLMSHDWPGNVRELENAIERAVVLGSGEEIRAEDLPEELMERPRALSAETAGYHQTVLAEKRRVILDAIQQARGNHTEAAARLGINPTYLSRLIRNLELKDEIRRAAER
jgi:Nif-specific regulatory protein